MSFYITDIHPEDAFYSRRKDFIGRRVTFKPESLLWWDGQLRPKGYIGLGTAHINGTARPFYAIKLTWEDY